MPKSNLVSATLTAEDLAAIRQALAVLRAKLPFLLDLTSTERRRLLKMGDGSRAFVEKALNAARANPGVLPGNFPLAEFERDWTLWSQIASLVPEVTQLAELLDDTAMALGSDLMNASVEAYGYLGKADGVGLDDLRAELGRRFEKRRTDPPSPGTPPTPPA